MNTFSKNQINKTSKFLSYVLRHKPDSIGLVLDANGWASIEELINQAHQYSSNPELSNELIFEVTKQSEKQRFAISDDGQSIRANQGHSVNIDLSLKPTEPPNILYHGTATRFIDSIFAEGLKAGSRQHVHLSTNINTANAVGQRHGKPVILKIDALGMFEEGHEFYLSENEVWLTVGVPEKFIIQYQSH